MKNNRKCYISRDESAISHLHHDIRLHDAMSGEVLQTATTIESLLLYTYEHHIDLPVRAKDGSFVHDDKGRWIYRDAEGYLEYADDSLVTDAVVCTDCGGLAISERVEGDNVLKEEEEGGRMAYVCTKCGYHMFEMPDVELIGALD